MRRRRSIQMQVLALVILATAPLVALGAWLVYAQIQENRQEAGRSNLQLAQLAAAHVQQFLAETRTQLEQLAERPPIKALDPGESCRIFNEVRDLMPALANIGLRDLRGNLLASVVTPPPGVDTSAAGVPWFERFMDRKTFVVGPPTKGRITEKWVSVLAAPVRDAAGAVTGALAFPVDLGRFGDLLRAVVLPEDGIITIIDGDGLVVTRIPSEGPGWIGRDARGTEIVDIALAGTQGVVEARSLDQRRRVFGYAAIEGPGWHVYVGVPSAVVYAEAKGKGLRAALLALASLLASVGLAVVVSRRVKRPVASLAAATAAVASGRSEVNVPVDGPLEIATVAARFNEMAGAVHAARTGLEEARDSGNQIIASLGEGLIVMDRERRYRVWNRAMEQLSGYRAADVIGHRPEELFPFLVEQGWVDRVDQVLRGEKVPALDINYTVPGRTGWSWEQLFPLRNPQGDIVGVIVTVDDITERKSSEAEQHRLQVELARRERMAAIGALVSSVAHEVRNPLFGISATVDAFEARFGTQPAQSRYLERLRQEIDRLNAVMQGLLDYARPVQLEVKPCRPADILGLALAGCRALAESRSVHCDLRTEPDLPEALLDREKAVVALRNLLDNAIRFSPAGGTVAARMRSLAEGGRRWIECTIEDRGPGIRAEDLPHVFEPFFSRRQGGTGLGLSITRRLVEDHGGTLAAGNRPDGGAVFTVRLPAMALAASEEASARSAGDPA